MTKTCSKHWWVDAVLPMRCHGAWVIVCCYCVCAGRRRAAQDDVRLAMAACDRDGHSKVHLRHAGDNANVAACLMAEAGDYRMSALYHHQDLLVCSVLHDTPGMVRSALLSVDTWRSRQP